MQTKKQKKKGTNQQIYLTQQELAQRWRVSESTIKKWRDEGQIPFFRPPGSIRPLYPIIDIMAIEVDRRQLIHKDKSRNVSETKIAVTNKPVAPNTKWEV